MIVHKSGTTKLTRSQRTCSGVRYIRPLTPCLVELDILLVVHVLLDDFQWCTTYS